MNILLRLKNAVGYLVALSAVLILHVYALHLDETSEIAAPDRVSAREA